MSFRTVVVFMYLNVLGYFLIGGKAIRLFCGPDIQPYYRDTEDCVDGQVVPRKQHDKTLTALNETVSQTDPARNRLPRRHCSDYADILRCNGKIHCGRHEGYKCCGFKSYHPNIQTCCRQSSAVYRIHDGKPERNHICCQLDVYRRGSVSVPCAHTSNNDLFFQKPKHLNKLRENKMICRDSFNVFRIDIRRGNDVTAVVRMWDWKPSKQKLRLKKSGVIKKKMYIKFDRFSKNKNIFKNSFILVSKYNFIEDSFLYLKSDDILYKSPKKHRNMARILRTIHSKC